MTASSTSTGQHAPRHFPRREVALTILIGMNAVYFFAYFHRVGIPGTIFNELQSEFAVSASAVATLGAIYLYIYGGMQLFAGMMNDRLGAVRVLLIGGLLLSIGSLLFPLSHTLMLLYASRALVGIGSSLIYISIVKALDMLFPPALFAQLLGISMFFGLAGGLASTYPLDRAVHQWGWRGALLGVGVLCALAFLSAIALFGRAREVRHRPAVSVSPAIIGGILKNRASLPMLFCGPINFSNYFLVQTVLGKKFLLDSTDMNPALAAAFPFIMMLVSMGAVIGGGFLPRLIGHRRKPIIMASIATTTLGVGGLLLLLHLGASGPWFLVCYVVMALSTLNSPSVNSLMKELNHPEAVGTAIGALNGAYYLVVALVTSMAGVVMDAFKAQATTTAASVVVYPDEAYFTIFAICFFLGLAAFAVSLFLKESYGRSLYAEAPAPASPTSAGG